MSAPTVDPRVLSCPLCGFEFPPEKAARSACSSCLLAKTRGRDSCGYLRCPSCGYEIPVEPKWITATRTFFSGLFRRGEKRRLGA